MGLSREAIGLRASWELKLAQLVTWSLTRLPSLLRSSRPGLLKLVSLHPENIRHQDPVFPVFCPCLMAFFLRLIRDRVLGC